MFLLVPLRTDAPVYRTPYATIGVMVLCSVLSIGAWLGILEMEDLYLDYDGFSPHRWVTANFMHAGVLHLVGNLIFLWTFGMIVEGRTGWWRFLIIFLAIGATECAIEQLLFSDGASLGASGVIFGLMGMSLVWAPVHEITWLWVFLFRFGQFESKVRTAAIVFTAIELFWLVIFFLGHGFTVTSELLHLMGLVIGTPIGVWMLRKGLVDCEGWDWFSVQRGDHLKQTYTARRVAAASRRGASGSGRSLFDAGRATDDATDDPGEAVRAAVTAGDVEAAVRAARAVRSPLSEEDLGALANLLYRSREWDEAATTLAEYVQRFPGKSARIALRLAHVRTSHQQRPRAALELLAKIPAKTLDPGERRWYEELTSRAEALAAKTPLELDDEAW